MRSVPWNFRPSMSRYPELWRGCVGAWYPGAGPQGLSLYDFSGYGNHGTLTNMDPATDWVVGAKGGALEFGNTTERVQSALVTTAISNIGCACWFRRTATGTATQILAYNGSSGANGWGIFLSSGRISGLAGGVVIINTPTNVTPAIGEDVHVAMFRAASAWEIWINGVPQGVTATNNPKTPTNQTLIGGNTASNESLSGLVYEAQFFTRRLSDSEIRLLATRPGVMFQQRPRRSYFLPSASAALVPILMHRKMMMAG